ncbi:HIT-like protein [Testicularia cyperi]|uniref:HIT-like protein n=1 Tax=Testicularia cyperi TaxID=1882483 RepID=A0A317XW73_9BASI|nr:HIT-like protein [Testicularia cyperi]
MTSHTLARFDASKEMRQDCAFCRIVSGDASAFVVYEDDKNLAFLDILPLRRGHTLVVPKKHVQQISHLEPDQAASLSKALVNTTKAVAKALNDERLQIVTNQVYAQIVPHVSRDHTSHRPPSDAF